MSQVEIIPRSATKDDLIAIRKELRRLQQALVDSEAAGNEADGGLEHLLLVGMGLREYGRQVALALHGLSLAEQGGGTKGFDDHDQFASLLVFLSNRYHRLSGRDGKASPQQFIKWARRNWRLANVEAAGSYKPSVGRDELERRDRPTVGIVTVLEHEYQSVLRRLDAVQACSDDTAYGFGILDRLEPTDDVDNRFLEGKGARAFGWADGVIGAHRVVVVCTGRPGGEEAKRAILAVEEMISDNGIPVRGWLVVGICGGSSREWPIGTVLISRDLIAGVRRDGSLRYEKGALSLAEPMTVGEIGGSASVKNLFRSPPAYVSGDVSVASPTAVPVSRVKFACTPHVVNKAEDLAALRKFLESEGVIGPAEEFGIEMEGVGAEFTHERKVCVVKGVSDYADDAKGGGWPRGVKNLFQLYASETAADVAVRMVRSWSS